MRIGNPGRNLRQEPNCAPIPVLHSGIKFKILIGNPSGRNV
jgi:hypothetical protein